MVHNGDRESLFPQVSEEELWRLSEQGREVRVAAGEVLFTQGDAHFPFYVLLEGRVRTTRQVEAGEEFLKIHRPGEFTGDLAMLTGSMATCTARAINSCKLWQIEPEAFKRVIGECSRSAAMVLAAMAKQTEEAQVHISQQQKLATLGKLSAGLAHELNNPAAAGKRAAKQLREAVGKMQQKTLMLAEYDLSLPQRQALNELRARAIDSLEVLPGLDPIAISDREDAIAQWLEDMGVADSWQLAPNLVWAGIDEACLNELNQKIGPAALAAVLDWLEVTLTVSGLVRELEQSSIRISDLVKALKSYSHREKISLQKIDIHEGIEITLTILHYKLKQGISVKREYDLKLPQILAYGSELAQVWTNLIDNAIDAMNGNGELTIRTTREGDAIVVTIADNGPGIPEEIQSRIFEPFFTTKDMDRGTGLGLDITRRIVEQRHRGSISFYSEPGQTYFQIYLPIESQAGV